MEPVPFSTDSISRDFASLIKKCCQFFIFHGSLNSKLHALIAAKKLSPSKEYFLSSPSFPYPIFCKKEHPYKLFTEMCHNFFSVI